MADSEFLPKLPVSELAAAVAEAASLAYGNLCEQMGESSPNGFALCVDCDVRSFFWKANTEAALIEDAESWLMRTMRRFRETAYSHLQALNLFRGDPVEWRFGESTSDEVRLSSQAAMEVLDRIWKTYERDCPDEDFMFDHSDEVRQACLDAIVEGMKVFESRQEWSPEFRRLLLLLVHVCDPDDPEENQRLAKRLN